MKKLIILIAILLPTLSHSQEKSIIQADGEDWNQVSQSYKFGYIHGYISSVSQQFSELQYYIINESEFDKLRLKKIRKKMESRMFVDITTGTIIDFIDKFYYDPINRKIPIHEAMRIASAAFDAIPEKELNEFIQILRWIATNPYSGDQDWLKNIKNLFPIGLNVYLNY